MAINNIEALNLSLEQAELEQIIRPTPTVPTVEFFKNNKSGIDLAYNNVHFQIIKIYLTKNSIFSTSLLDTSMNQASNPRPKR